MSDSATTFGKQTASRRTGNKLSTFITHRIVTSVLVYKAGRYYNRYTWSLLITTNLVASRRRLRENTEANS